MLRPTAIGGSIAVADSDELATLSLDGLPVGSIVWNIDVGAPFKLTQMVRTDITLETTDGYDSPTWTLANATFTGFEGCTLSLVLQAPNVAFSRAYVIDTVGSATEVDVVDPPDGQTTGELFGSAVLYADALVTDSVVDANGVIGLRWVKASDATGITQLTGDVTAGPGAGSVAATLANIPTTATMAGKVTATAIAAPATPAAGKGAIYVDSTSKNLAVKDDAGVVKHGVQSMTTAGQIVTAIHDDGTVDHADGTPNRVTKQTLAGTNATITVAGLTGTAKYLRIYCYLPTNATTGLVVIKYNSASEVNLASNWVEITGTTTVQGARNLAQWEVAGSTGAADRIGGNVFMAVNATDTFLNGEYNFWYGNATTRRIGGTLTTGAIAAITSISVVAQNASAFSIGAYVEVTEIF